MRLSALAGVPGEKRSRLSRRWAKVADVAPTVVRDGAFRLFFFSREEERMHVHVAHPDGEAKFWLLPEVRLANHTGLTVRQLREA
jgi:Domain of unknown function (DUF4160)